MWQRADGQWQTGTNGSLTFFGLTAGQTYTIYARYEAIASGDSPAFVSGESSTQAATKASTGQAPTVTGIVVTDTTIKLPDNAAWEYSTDRLTWNSTHEFTGLTPATQYTYYIREKETDDTEASEIATVTVYTAYAAPAAGAMRSTRRRTSGVRELPVEVPWLTALDRPSISVTRRMLTALRQAQRWSSRFPPVLPHPV